MQSFSSRIWTRVAVSISYDDNHYTTGTSIVYSHTQLRGHFTGCTKIKIKTKQKKTKVGRKKETRWSWHFLAFCVYSWLPRKLCENLIQLPKMLTHLVIVYTVLCLRSTADWTALRFGPKILTLFSGVSLLTNFFGVFTINWLTPFVLLFRDRRFSQG